MNTAEKFAWIALGLLLWFGIRAVWPEVAGLILIAVVLLALFKIAPKLAKG